VANDLIVNDVKEAVMHYFKVLSQRLLEEAQKIFISNSLSLQQDLNTGPQEYKQEC
jgi:hypothetical protein